MRSTFAKYHVRSFPVQKRGFEAISECVVSYTLSRNIRDSSHEELLFVALREFIEK